MVRAKKATKEHDTQEAASFLLSLKHPGDGNRSVTPELPKAKRGDDASRGGPWPRSYRGDAPFYYYNMPYRPIASLPEEPMHIDWEAMAADSKLVLPKDRELVPDALFLAMAQMKPCTLTPADRVGCYKNRELGFVGMCCLHCGGQPGFGRYYPNSVRSLAQTTTSQTIIKHVSGKCRFCPPAIRNAILELQRIQAVREAQGRPRYGSRKVFFQRVWARLHSDDDSNGTPTDVDEITSMASEDAYDTKRKVEEAVEPPAKRVKGM